MRKYFCAIAAAFMSLTAVAQTYYVDSTNPEILKHSETLGTNRTEIFLPQVNGYNVYKADLHTHTLYSDGSVMPAFRVLEAWQQGLDIIAITDHLESRRTEEVMVKYLKKYLEEHPVDLIVSTGPPQSMHLIGRRLARETGIPWIADFRDPWTKIFYFKHLSMTRATQRWHKRMEKKVLDDATAVVAVSPLVQQEFQAMTQTSVELITNGYDECDFPHGKCEEATGGPDKDFTITHTGLFAADGNPTTLWSVLAEKCAKDEDFRKLLKIKLVGKTDEQIIGSIKEAGLEENLIDMGYQPHAAAVEEQRRASLLILPLRKEPEYKAVLPGKLFEYLASWRPVLGIGQPDGAMSMILNTTKTGIVLNWEDKTSISRFIDYCWKKHQSGELTVEDADISRFTRRNLTHQMATLFNDTTKL